MSLALPLVTNENLQFVIDRLASSVVDTGDRVLKVRFGISTVTWPGGSTASNTTTIAHGMGTTPVFAAGFLRGPLQERCVIYEAADADATNISLAANQSAGVNPALNSTQNIYWLAIG